MLYTGKYAGSQYTREHSGPVLRPDRGERAVHGRSRTCSPAAACSGARVERPHQRHAAVLARRVPHRRRRRHDGRGPPRRPRRRHAVHRARLGLQRRGQRGEPGPQRLVHHDERHPADPARVPAVRELGRGRVGPRGRPVRAAHRRRLRLLADRRRVVQAADAHDRRPGRRRHAVVLDVVRHRGRVGPPGRRGPHRRRRRLDDAARCQRRTRRRAPATAARPAGASCTRSWTTTRRSSTTTTCDPTGTTGEWNAASGNSGGWQQWSVDLSAYAGGQVEVSIAYVSDWATQGLGVFVDDIEVSTGEGTTSFEAGDTGGWEITGPPPAARRTRTTSSSRRRRASPRPRWWPRRTRC